MADLSAMLSILVTANHVLDHFGLVNGFGHVSVRDPGDPSRFYMTGHAPPRFVQSSDDLYHYTVVDGSPAAGGSAGTSPWSERFVHQGIYKRYAEVKSVVDSHSQVVVAAGVSGVPMRAAYHMAGFVGSHDVPNFDASSCYGSDQKRNMLINDVKLGEGLASALECCNAATASLLAAAFSNTAGEPTIERWTIKVLTEQEAADSAVMDKASVLKAWVYWSRLVQTMPIYKNDIARDTAGEIDYRKKTTAMYGT